MPLELLGLSQPSDLYIGTINPTLHILGKYSLFKIVLNKLQSVGRITSELALIISFAIESLPDVLLFFNFWISLLISCNEISLSTTPAAL